MVEVTEIQALALRSYRRLPHSAYIPLRASRKAAEPRTWLNKLLAIETGGVMFGPTPKTPKAAERIDAAINVAFSYEGLRRLGLDPRTLDEFSLPFQSGMADAHRASELGDIERSAPREWKWGRQDTEAHVLLLLYAVDATHIESLLSQMRTLADTHHLTLVTDPLKATWPYRKGVEGTREHFGFVDGLAQPRIDFDGRQSGKVPEDSLLADGELLLGYPDEAGTVKRGPTVARSTAAMAAGLPQVPGSTRHDFGRNGTYLVFRELEQHVTAFWQFVQKHAGAVGSLELCAAKLMGRWRNGAPLTLATDPPATLDGVHEEEYFRFRDHDDANGSRCPIGAHIRRANPRDTLAGLSARRSLAEVRRHRIFRRGRPYGPTVEGWPDPTEMLEHKADTVDGERGLYFICLNADIQRQFEHIQQRWFNDPTFVNRPNSEVDPIVGRALQTTRFRIPAKPVPTLLDGFLPDRPFVTLRGGGYFFLPSRPALRYLAAGA